MTKVPIRNSLYNYRYFIVLLVFLLVLGATFYFVREENKLFESQQRLTVTEKVSSVRAALEKAVNERLYTITALGAYVRVNNGEVVDEEFEILSSALLTDQFKIRSVQLAPDGVVTYVAPLEGNEAAIGHNLLVDDNRKEAVRRAIDTNSYIVAGPVELIQGGVALIARQPVYLPSDLGPFGSEIVNEHGSFWGFATLLIDLDVFIENADIDSANFEVAVRGKDGLGAAGEVFLGDPSVFDNDPVTQEVVLPDGAWQVGAIPTGGWTENTPFGFLIWFISFLFSTSVSALFLFILSQPRRLEAQVKKATEELNVLQNVLASQNKTLESNVKELKTKNEEIGRSRKAVLNILEDVNEEKERITTILNSIGDGVFVVDTDHIIRTINPIAAELSGYSVEEALGKPYKEILRFVYEKDGSVNDSFVTEAIRTGEIQEMSNHTLLVKRDESTIPVADSAAPLKNTDGRVLGCVVVFRDISKEYAIDKAKTEFVSLASHQLRTPLAAINWNLEILLDEKHNILNDEQRQALGDVYSSSKRLTELVNALLNVSRIELGTFAVDPEPTDIIALTKEVVKDLQPSINEKNLQFAEHYGDETLTMDVDPKLMRMVIENLLSNSVKYTPEGKYIEIALRKEAEELIMHVRDEGYGIPDAQQEKIFTRLFRADNVRAKDTEGTGLGLYIVKSIVEHSGGRIWFESVEDQGTTFYVTLPLGGMRKKEGTRKLT